MVGPVEAALFADLAPVLDDALGLEVRTGPALSLPPGAWEPSRGQYNASHILKDVAAARPLDAVKILALTEVDLFHPDSDLPLRPGSTRGCRRARVAGPPAPGLLRITIQRGADQAATPEGSDARTRPHLQPHPLPGRRMRDVAVHGPRTTRPQERRVLRFVPAARLTQEVLVMKIPLGNSGRR